METRKELLEFLKLLSGKSRFKSDKLLLQSVLKAYEESCSQGKRFGSFIFNNAGEGYGGNGAKPSEIFYPSVSNIQYYFVTPNEPGYPAAIATIYPETKPLSGSFP